MTSLTDNAKSICEEIPPRKSLGFSSKLVIRPAFQTPPSWARLLDQTFAIDGKIQSSSAGAVLLFKCDDRVMACAYGFGHVLLDSDRRENDFGLLVAANSLSDENVKLVEKANLGSVIRDAAQAAGITRLQEFGVDRALSLVRRLSGSSETVGSLSGASSITMTSEYEIHELEKLGKILLELYRSTAYQKTGFGIIDKIKPVHGITLLAELDDELVKDLQGTSPSFELGVPEIETQPTGYITISGTKNANSLLTLVLGQPCKIDGVGTVQDLYDHKIVTYNIDGTVRLKEWSIYRGLVGSLQLNGKRYALNEGHWYLIDDALIKSAKSAFDACTKGLDKTFLPWPIIASKKKNGFVYEREYDFNSRVCTALPSHLLFDTNLFPIPNIPGPGVEICDIFDVPGKKLIHVKRSGRRSSVISHFLNQGMNSAKLLRTYDRIRDDFFSELGPRLITTT